MSVEPEDLVEDATEAEDEQVPFRYSITAYGADYLVESIVQRMARNDIYIPPFQRQFVWSIAQSSRFIESLLLGLPVPGIFLSKEEDTQRHIVIDGQQRLRTLQFFYSGLFGTRQFALKGVKEELLGKTYASLSDADRRRLDDSIIHTTIVKQDEPSDDKSSIYQIFERLNTGGTLLSPQEIRACIYYGPFNELIQALNDTQEWRRIFGPKSRRLKDHELILRFLALHFWRQEYDKPMKGFLNNYMGGNRHFELTSADQARRTFTRTIRVALRVLGDRAFKPKRGLNTAVFDSVMVGLAERLEQGEITSESVVATRYSDLLQADGFVRAVETGTSDKESVARRVNLAICAFSDVR